MEIFPGVKISDITSEIDSPFVSVGSGNGSTEWKIRESIQHAFPVITIDPNPESYVKYPKDGKFIPPHYNYVKDLIASKPGLVNNCILFICWPEYDSGAYDFDAIESLRPRKVISLYEQYGGAGSDSLHHFMKTYGVPNKFYSGLGPYEGTDYKVKKTIVKKNKHCFGVNTDVFVVLERTILTTFQGLAS